MKKFLGIVILGLLWCNFSHSEIIKIKCYGFNGVGNKANKSSDLGWIGYINTENKTYKTKFDGSTNWLSMIDLGTTITYFGDEYFEWEDSNGKTGKIDFIKFTETTSPGGYLQYDCVRTNVIKTTIKTTESGEITDKEWASNYWSITYYHPSASRVECTAFNSNNKAIAGGSGTFVGSVATVILKFPKKYAGKNQDLKCKTK